MNLFKRVIKYLLGLLPVRCRCHVRSFASDRKVISSTNVFIHPSVHLIGRSNISVGDNTCISEECWLNVNHRVRGKVCIDIGNQCFIGKRNFFTAGLRIVVRDYTMTTLGCSFLGSSHVINDPLKPYLVAGTTSDGEIVIGVNCFIGVKATVLGDVRIGHGSVIGAGSMVLHDIPPFSVSVGNPAKVIKRYSFIKKEWVPAPEFTDAEEQIMPDENEYLEILKKNYKQLSIPWIVAGRDMGNL